MTEKQIIGTYTIGILYRKRFRVLFDTLVLRGVGKYTESKGIFDSVFVVLTYPRMHKILLKTIKELNKD